MCSSDLFPSHDMSGLANNKIHTVRKNATGKWEKPELIGSEVNTIDTDDAVKNYAVYLKKDSTNPLALTGVQLQKTVDKIKSVSTGYVVKKADAFNARKSWTFSPSYSGYDADALFFTSNRVLNTKTAIQPNLISGLANNKIYTVRKNATGKWEKPELIGSEVNTIDTDDGVCSFSPDGKIMYFTRAIHKDSCLS